MLHSNVSVSPRASPLDCGADRYGIASWRIRVFPRYVAWTLILFEPASILTGVALSPIAPLHDSGSYTGGIEKAVAVLILGLAARQLAASPQVPARV